MPKHGQRRRWNIPKRGCGKEWEKIKLPFTKQRAKKDVVRRRVKKAFLRIQ